LALKIDDFAPNPTVHGVVFKKTVPPPSGRKPDPSCPLTKSALDAYGVV